MANDTHQEPAAEAVHRLHDIVVEEVSLVDRAANKRRFLLVKRNNQMGKIKSAEADGNQGKPRRAPPWAKKKTKAKKPPAGEKTHKARRRAGGADEDAEKARAKGEDDACEDDETEKASDENEAEEDLEEDDDGDQDEEEDEDEDDETEKAEEADEDEDDETEKADEADDEEEDEEEEDEDDEDEESSASKAHPPAGAAPAGSAKSNRGKDGTSKAGAAGALVLAPAAKAAAQRALVQALETLMAVTKRIGAAKQASRDADARVPDTVASELAGIGKLLEDVAGRLLPSHTSVTKGGARMARNRLDRFQKALSLLSEVLKELTEAKNPPTPGAARPASKRDTAPELRELATSLGELTRVVKHQEEALGAMRKARGTSNAIAVDGGGHRREPQDVSWPLDMNRPISRDSVAKTVSFYDT